MTQSKRGSIMRMTLAAVVLVLASARYAYADLADPLANPSARNFLLLAGVVVIALAVAAVALIVRFLRKGRRGGRGHGPVPPQHGEE